WGPTPRFRRFWILVLLGTLCGLGLVGRGADAGDAEQAVDLAAQVVDGARGVAAAHGQGDAARRAFIGHAHAVDVEAAALHQADETLKRAVGPVDLDVNGVAHAHAPSIISALLLPGGTRGQTFSL